MTETVPPVTHYAVAGAFLEALAAQDFAGLGATLADDARMQALVPVGLREWCGSARICAAFISWFGDVGSRLYLRWRLRPRAARLGGGWFVIEQHVYADANRDGLISRLRLLCSGSCYEQDTE